MLIENQPQYDRKSTLWNECKKFSLNQFQHLDGFKIKLAGKIFNIKTHSQELAQRMRTYFQDYLTQENQIDSVLYLKTLSSDLLWEDESADFFPENRFVTHRDFSAIKINDTDIYAIVAPELDDAFHNLLRWHISNLALQNNIFLMHSAGLIFENEAYLFFGQSGAGKSTVSSLISEYDSRVELVGDDAVFVEFKNDQLLMHSAPLGCGYSRIAPQNKTLPIARMFSLEQASQNQILKINQAQAVTKILASAMNADFTFNTDQQFKLANAIAETGLVKHLKFNKNPQFWRLIIQERAN